METKFNLKSAICTSREQSERLIALGLKKTTADCVWIEMSKGDWRVDANGWKEYYSIVQEGIFPAWSLGRLIKDLMPQRIGHLELAVGGDYTGYYEDRYNSENGMYWEYVEDTLDMFDNIISTIEWLIKEGYFNKEYLV